MDKHQDNNLTKRTPLKQSAGSHIGKSPKLQSKMNNKNNQMVLFPGLAIHQRTPDRLVAKNDHHSHKDYSDRFVKNLVIKSGAKHIALCANQAHIQNIKLSNTIKHCAAKQDECLARFIVKTADMDSTQMMAVSIPNEQIYKAKQPNSNRPPSK